VRRDPSTLNQVRNAIRSTFKNANIAASKYEFQPGAGSIQIISGQPIQFVCLRDIAIQVERM
jgi:hypothetical protein